MDFAVLDGYIISYLHSTNFKTSAGGVNYVDCTITDCKSALAGDRCAKLQTRASWGLHGF